ncbi:hypothetical protein [Janthinobacterium sp. LB3P112]|uniref:hypothetical protein n=1 Tax=Janthinobacterium sp. LB3P112 TaxID=3424196 RepID=UPI003F247146
MKVRREKCGHAALLRRALAGNSVKLGQPIRPRYRWLQAMSLAQLHGVYFIGMGRHMTRPQLRRGIGRQRVHLRQHLCRHEKIGIEERPVRFRLQRPAGAVAQGCYD